MGSLVRPRLFSLQKLSYRYPESTDLALSGVNLEIAEGEFVLVLGPSGCGKSTLARALGGFIPKFYGGEISGDVLFEGSSLIDMPPKRIRESLGMVFQDPEKQLLMAEVQQEIAFGLENLGVERASMLRRVSETLSYLNLSSKRFLKTASLSSGEQQKVAIGAILAMNPRVLILDEPTSQLSPPAAAEVFSLLRALNQEHGVTVVLVEQHFEHCFSLATRVLLLDSGRVQIDASPEEFVKSAQEAAANFVPSISRLLGHRFQNADELSVRDARPLLRDYLGISSSKAKKKPGGAAVKSNPVLALEKLSFNYKQEALSEPVLHDLSLEIYAEEFLAVVGENGAGKSTLLKLLAGVLSAQKGEIYKSNARIAYLSQDPNDYLFHDTLEEELRFTMNNLGLSDENALEEILCFFELSRYRHSYPRDLSVGERQRAALTSILVGSPEILLLDEPTRGLDAMLKQMLGKYLKKLVRDKHTSVVLVTQDMEFCAEHADRVLLLSGGEILDDGLPEQVFHDNLFFSTNINRLFRGIRNNVVNMAQAEEIIREVENA